jgi:hypothetical protein
MTDPALPVIGEYRHLHTNKNEGPQLTSSITIGTPGKGGKVKIYFDPSDPGEAEQRIREAFKLRELARLLNEGQAVPA